MLGGEIRVYTRLNARGQVNEGATVTQPLYISSDNIVVVGPVVDRLGNLTTAQLEAATGTATLKDSSGANVAGAVSLALTRITGTTRYYANIPDTVSITSGATYSLVVSLTAGGVKLTLEEPLVGTYKT